MKKTKVKKPRKPPRRVKLQLEPLPQQGAEAADRRKMPRPGAADRRKMPRERPIVIDEDNPLVAYLDAPLHELLAAQGVPI